jgi:outer membrane protein assembly factor BamD (BamD/ComL family)
MRTSAACQEARDEVAEPLGDELTRARIAAHRSRCAPCRAYAARLHTTADAVRAAAGPGLDDIARARVTARLALAIDELATHNWQRQRSPRRTSFAWSAAVAGVAAVAATILIVSGYRSPARPPASPPLATRAPVETGGSAPARSLAGARAGADRAPELSKGRLEVPAGAVVRATVDRYTALTVIGPAQLVVETVAPEVALRLESGLLVGEYEHHPGGTLRVHSPGATTTVVGTLFAVQALGGGRSRVAVRRGAVVVAGRGETVHLGAGWSWSSGEAARPELPVALDEQLTAHAAAQAGPAPEAAQRARRLRPLAPLVPAGPAGAERAASPSSAQPPAASPEAPAVAAGARDEQPAAAPASPPKSEAAATADSLYAEAEAAMRAGDRAAVQGRLTEVIRRFPQDGLAAAALYELARREQAAGQLAQARAHLDRLLAHEAAQELREPARYLRCRLELDAHRDADALACLDAFRRDFPASPHDAEVLALLIGLYQLRADCPRALPLLDEYLRRYPGGPLDASARRTRCAR